MGQQSATQGRRLAGGLTGQGRSPKLRRRGIRWARPPTAYNLRLPSTTRFLRSFGPLDGRRSDLGDGKNTWAAWFWRPDLKAYACTAGRRPKKGRRKYVEPRSVCGAKGPRWGNIGQHMGPRAQQGPSLTWIQLCQRTSNNTRSTRRRSKKKNNLTQTKKPT